MNMPRPRWVIAELDVNGEIDDHAALCLHYAIEGARERAPETIVVDLRELSAIGDDGLGQFLDHDAACAAGHVQLAILVCAGARQQEIVGAFTAAGLRDRLCFADSPTPNQHAPRAPRVSVRRYPRPATARR